LITALLHATAIGGGNGGTFLCLVSAILTTILALPRAAHDHPGDRGILRLVLSVLLLDVIVYLVIHLLVLTTARASYRGTRRRAGGSASGTPTGLRTIRAGGAGAAGLGLACAYVLLGGFGRLPFKRRYCLCGGAKAKHGEDRGYTGEYGLFHGKLH
jgi:hypothetical protein